MKRFMLLALMKALVLTVGTGFLYVLYGLIFENHFEGVAQHSLHFGELVGVILVIFFVSLIEYVWKNRKK